MKIKVDAYTMTPSVITVGTAGSYGSAVLDFYCSRDWDGLLKKASFYLPSANVVVLMEGNRVQVPAEVFERAGTYDFALSGYGDGKIILSLTGSITVLPTKEPAVTPPGSPTPSEMEQIYQMVMRATINGEKALDAAEFAEAAARDARITADQAANEALNIAKQAAADAMTAAQEAVDTADAATQTALQAAKDALAAAKAVGDSLVDARVNDQGHLILTFEGGNVQDAGSVRGKSVEGAYRGGGSENHGEQHIVLGFRPALLTISHAVLTEFTAASTASVVFGSGLMDDDDMRTLVEFTDDGFTVYDTGTPNLNEWGIEYRYTALSESLPTEMVKQTVTDCFDRVDDALFTGDCKGLLAPKVIGQLMIGPGGRLFVGIGGHESEGNAYGKWLPLIDDNGKSGSDDATTYSAAKITSIANGLSMSIGNMGQSLSSAISSIGAQVGGKADQVNGCVQMNGCNVMGYVRELLFPEDDPNLLRSPGIYGVVSEDPAWTDNALPPDESAGLLEVLPEAGGVLLQRFVSPNGYLFFRVKNLFLSDRWGPWGRIA